MNALDYESSEISFYKTARQNHQQEEFYKSKNKYKRLTGDEKQDIAQNINLKKMGVFLYKNITEEYSSHNIEINNYDDLFDFFSKINILDYISPTLAIDSYCSCILFEGNIAWISKNNEGHYRYFTKKIKSKKTIGLDMLDLIEIYYQKNALKTIGQVIKDFKIKFMESDWMNEQNKKYLSNLTIIHNPKKYLINDYSIVYDYIKPHLKMLETMNVIGNINIKKKEFSKNNHNIFFASNSYISDFLGNYKASTTNKVLNMFAVLGLINKISETEIPPQLLHESRVISERRNLGNIISYYIIPPMTEILAKAEEIAEIMNNNNVKYSNISRDKISYIFGEDFTKEIYVQEIQKNKLKNSEIQNTIYKDLEDNFFKNLNNRGFVTKTSLTNDYLIENSINLNEIKNKLEKIWKSMIIKYELRYMKPTYEQRKEFNLFNNEYIAVK